LGWLWGRNRLAINRLCGGFDMALMWLWVALPPSAPFDVGYWMFDVGCSLFRV